MRAFIALLFCLGGFLIGFSAGYLASMAFTRADAVEHGAGDYTADGREWKWK